MYVCSPIFEAPAGPVDRVALQAEIAPEGVQANFGTNASPSVWAKT